MIIHSLFKDYEVSIERDSGFISELINENNAGFVIDKKVYVNGQKFLEMKVFD